MYKRSNVSSSSESRHIAKRKKANTGSVAGTRTLRPSYRALSSAGGFPPVSKLVHLRYSESFTLDAGMGTIASYAFRANSLYDPNYTGTGHQPMFFDQWAALYQHYNVVSSKITWESIPTENTATPYVLSLSLDDDGAHAATSSTELGERPNTVSKLFPCRSDGHKCYVLTQTFSMKKFFGVKDVLNGADKFGAAYNANPTEVAMFILSYCSAGAVDPAAIWNRVTIDFAVRFSEPKDIGGS